TIAQQQNVAGDEIAGEARPDHRAGPRAELLDPALTPILGRPPHAQDVSARQHPAILQNVARRAQPAAVAAVRQAPLTLRRADLTGCRSPRLPALYSPARLEGGRRPLQGVTGHRS